MRNLLIILTFTSFTATAQTVNVPSMGYTKASNVIRQDSTLLFNPAGYADYPVKINRAGTYTFLLRMRQLNSKAILAYIFSPSDQAWHNASVPVSPLFQDITIKLPLDTASRYFRLYFVEQAEVDEIFYTADQAPGGTVDLSPILQRLAAAEQRLTVSGKSIDSLRRDNIAKQVLIDSLNARYNRMPTIYFKGFPVRVTKDSTIISR